MYTKIFWFTPDPAEAGKVNVLSMMVDPAKTNVAYFIWMGLHKGDPEHTESDYDTWRTAAKDVIDEQLTILTEGDGFLVTPNGTVVTCSPEQVPDELKELAMIAYTKLEEDYKVKQVTH